MRTQFRVLAVSTLLAFAGSALAAAQAPAAKPLTPQQQRMKDCNAQASGKKGDERKTFMSSCLKGEQPAAAAAPATQQEKMKTCNADATGKSLKGDARKAFMSTCLKK
ncbi:MAG: Phosphate starvation-inducible protein PsiF [Luteibacter sp.]|uniref:PsiF family protein n=1 Tax=Luteibacter sp. TaxID=1886636 RepID=UPI001381A9C0|nr:PsiF family protein [Luteibacter sp.]KAF1004336.1 MAG: Phosphate starvation-inducible protein PsiF [Luteibacter sp.]